MSLISSSLKLSAMALGGLLLSACATPLEQDPVYIKLMEVDGRVLQVERVINNQSLLDLSQRNDALQAEIRVLRGQLEELQNSLDKQRTQSRDLYTDIDKRVQSLETAKASAPPVAEVSAPKAPQITDNEAYQSAFNLLKEFKYAEAAAAFSQFIANYSQSKLLDNAQYWLGEAHYGLKDFNLALRDFQGVISGYPESLKQPDALLKLGYTQYELKNYKEARAALQQVVKQYPESNAAKLAQLRLAKMTAEGR